MEYLFKSKFDFWNNSALMKGKNKILSKGNYSHTGINIYGVAPCP